MCESPADTLVIQILFVFLVVISMFKPGAAFKLQPMPLVLLIQPRSGFGGEVGEDGIGAGAFQAQQ